MNQTVFNDIKKEILGLLDFNGDTLLTEYYLYAELLDIFKIPSLLPDKRKELKENMITVINYLPKLDDSIIIHKTEKDGICIFRYKKDENQKNDIKDLISKNNLLRKKIRNMNYYRQLINILAFIGFLYILNILLVHYGFTKFIL